MLNLQKHIDLDEAAIKAANVAEHWDETDRRAIGEWVWAGYHQDRRSREKWERRTEAATDLAMQIQKAKSFPWPNCSNIAFPLITIAALQFHSRAYPALIQAPDIVKCRTLGPDPDGAAGQRAQRVSAHMSWQRLEEDQPWEESWDRTLIVAPIVGCAFRKTYRKAEKSYNASELVHARDFVLDYWAKSVEDCQRKTHIIPLYRNDIYERVMSEVFCDVREADWYKRPAQPTQTTQNTQVDNRSGVSRPPTADETTPFLTLEQHCQLDLDGDGYAEPWIITIEERSHCVLRIVSALDRKEDVERNSKGEVIRCRVPQYFTKVPFLPSPDGGIYDMGFGVLLGPLNESVNSIVNQLVDAGTLQNGRPILLGRGAKIRGGVYSFAPFSAQRVDSTGDDLRKSLVPLDVGEPSQVLFSLLTLLIEYTNRIPGTTEVVVGENPGQNTPAETSRNMLAQGLKIYSALFKRIWRSMGEEFRKLYVLNGIYLPEKQPFGAGSVVLRSDYLGNPTAIVPEADPNVSSEAERMQQTLMVAQRAQAVPGYDIAQTERMLLKAWRVSDVDRIYPGPDKVPQGKDPKIAVAEMKLQGEMLALQAENQRFMAELLEEHRMNTAKILELGAKAALEVEQAGGVRAGHQIAALDAAIGAIESHNDAILRHVELIMKGMEGTNGENGKKHTNGGGMGRLAQSPRDLGLALLGPTGTGGQESALGGGNIQP